MNHPFSFSITYCFWYKVRRQGVFWAVYLKTLRKLINASLFFLICDCRVGIYHYIASLGRTWNKAKVERKFCRLFQISYYSQLFKSVMIKKPFHVMKVCLATCVRHRWRRQRRCLSNFCGENNQSLLEVMQQSSFCPVVLPKLLLWNMFVFPCLPLEDKVSI